MVKYIITAICYFFVYGYCFAAPTVGELQRSIELTDENQAYLKKFEQSNRVYIEVIAVRSNVPTDIYKVRKIVASYEKSWLTKKDLVQLIEDVRKFYSKQGYSDEQIDISKQIIEDRLEIVVDISGAVNTP